MPQSNLLVESLSVSTRAGGLPILRDVDLELRRGELTAVVGESGSGKTTLLSTILGLLPEGLRIVSVSMRLEASGLDDALDLVALSPRQLRRVMGRRIGYVPQDCLLGLDPILPIGDALSEAWRCHARTTSPADRIAHALVEAGLPEDFLETRARSRPGELSGGQRQRVLIAKARLHEPQVVLYDEPTTALDPPAKRRVLDSIRAGIRDSGSALVVTHDLAAIGHYADQICVLYAGEVVEQGPGADVLRTPQHPYTRDLLRCLPRVDRRVIPTPIGGTPQVPESRSGCRYAARCSEALPICESLAPAFLPLPGDADGRKVRCHARARSYPETD